MSYKINLTNNIPQSGVSKGVAKNLWEGGSVFLNVYFINITFVSCL